MGSMARADHVPIVLTLNVDAFLDIQMVAAKPVELKIRSLANLPKEQRESARAKEE